MNNKRQNSGRIPIRFVDDASASASNDDDTRDDGAANDPDANVPSPEELGRESSYEDETEMGRRIDRGAEEEDDAERADERDKAGAPHKSELPERREDAETGSAAHNNGAGIEERTSGALRGDSASGPLIAELVATRAELKRVEVELQKSEAERNDWLEKLARRQADFDNYRKRIERERGETYNHVVGEVVSHLLPVVDNLRRALDAEASFESAESEEFRHFLHGIELISKQLGDVLAKLGVETVATVGEVFDPHVHEAIATEESDEFAPDIVTQEIVRGYRLGDKLLRPAMVKVSVK